MSNKPKIIVMVNDGVVEIFSTDPEAVEVLLIDQDECDSPGVGIEEDAARVSVEEFNDILDEAIDKIAEALEETADEGDIEVEEWKDMQETLKKFKI